MKLVLIIIALLIGSTFAGSYCVKNPTASLCKTISQADHLIQVQAAVPSPDLSEYTVAVWDTTTGVKVLKTTWTSNEEKATAFVTPTKDKDSDN